MGDKAKVIVKKNACLEAINIKKVIDESGKEIMLEGDVKLCTCGQSKNMPFCDGHHLELDQEDLGEVKKIVKHTGEATEPTIVLDKEGPMRILGDVEIEAESAVTVSEDHVSTFCRCGESKTKPFCDGSHTYCRFDRYDE